VSRVSMDFGPVAEIRFARPSFALIAAVARALRKQIGSPSGIFPSVTVAIGRTGPSRSGSWPMAKATACRSLCR